MIEHAGGDFDTTMKLCTTIFKGEDVPEDIGETSEDFQALKQANIRNSLPTSAPAVHRSYQEIAQHAKAASFLINQICIHGKDLTESILLQTHRILTYKVDAEDTPWEEYSGVYRTDEVSAGFHGFPAPSLVPSKMKGMISDLGHDLKEHLRKGTIDPVAFAAKITHIFVNIHPFLDGNGRMCRLILNTMLLKYGSYLVCIGDDEEDRHTYLEVAGNGSALEDLYEDAEEDEKPELHKELASFVLVHLKESLEKLIGSVSAYHNVS